MAEEKPLNLKAMREAFAAIKDRLAKLEQTVREQNAEAEIRTAYIRDVQRKMDRYALELDKALPRIIAAEAQIGRANANHDKLWGLLGETAHGIVKLREMVEGAMLEEPGPDGDAGDCSCIPPDTG